MSGYGWPTSATSKRWDGVVAPSARYFSFNATGVAPSRDPDYRWSSYPLRELDTEGEGEPAEIWAI